MTRRRYAFFGLAALIVLAAASCGPSQGAIPGDKTDTTNGAGSSGSAGEGSGTGSTTASGTGGSSGSGFGGTSGSAGGGNTGGMLGADAACGATILEPESIETTETIETPVTCTSEQQEPVALYIVLDNSGSMSDNNKWTDAVNAITTFVNTDPALASAWVCVDAAGNTVPAPADLPPAAASGTISVAIQYFHPENVASGDECDGTGHSTPAVPMGPLPDNAGNITASLSQTGPNGDTPTVGALTGGTQYCADYQLMNVPEKCIVVLITDGQPNGCGLSSTCGGFLGSSDCVDPNAASVLTPIAGNAYNDPNNSVITFTVGMDGITAEGFVLLDAIAVAGGSDCTPGSPGQEACNVTAGGQGLLDALNTIRESVQVTDTSTATSTTTTTTTTTLPCEWDIPTPPDGQRFDKNLVNVRLTTGGVTQTVGNVPAESDCASVGGGWYYDNVDAPARILACPSTCGVIETLTDATVQVLVGCATQPAIIQ